MGERGLLVEWRAPNGESLTLLANLSDDELICAEQPPLQGEMFFSTTAIEDPARLPPWTVAWWRA